MKVETISIGNELISGAVVDTNFSYLSNKAGEIGITINYHSIVDDDIDSIVDLLKIVSKRSDFIVVSGGLGPTSDDITRESASKFSKQKFVLRIEALRHIKELFSKRGIEMPSSNRKQALFPVKAELIPNPNGTAYGFILQSKKTLISFLPGVPYEFEKMVDDNIIPLLLKMSKSRFFLKTRLLKTFGLPESKLEELLESVISKNKKNNTSLLQFSNGVKIGFLPVYPEVYLKITARAKTEKGSKYLLNNISDKIYDILGKNIFGEDKDTLEGVVGNLLRRNKTTIAVAESCTGGLIGHLLTNIPGSSDYFERGVICYSNKSKIDILGVSPDTINVYGAVSKEVAQEMARGISRISNATFGIGITGIAGPSGGSEEKPVGTVYIAVNTNDDIKVKRYSFIGERSKIKIIAAKTALNMVRNILQ